MELSKTVDGQVTHLALVRALRGLSHKGVGHSIGVSAEEVLAWERDNKPIPSAKAKRIGLALRWPWEALLLEPMVYDEAYGKLVQARRLAIEPTAKSVAEG